MAPRVTPRRENTTMLKFLFATKVFQTIALSGLSLLMLPGCEFDLPGLSRLLFFAPAGNTYISQCEAIDLSPSTRSTIEALKKLSKKDTCLDSYNTLNQMVKMDLSHQRLKDLSPLAGFKRLRYLSLRGNAIDDLTPILALSQLIELDISQNNLATLPDLSKLPKLRIIAATNNQLTALKASTLPVGILRIDFADNPLVPESIDLALSELKYLNLSRCGLSTIAALKSSSLIELSLMNNGITSLDGITNLPNLEILILSRNAVVDITPLQQLSKLRFLWLDQNRIKDLTPIKEMRPLQTVVFDGNPDRVL